MNNKVTYNTDSETKLYDNTASDKILVSESNLRNIFNDHIQNLTISGSLITPLSIAVTILITLLTTDFKDFIFSSSVWKALFIWGLFFSSIGFLRQLYRIMKNWGKCSTDYLIDRIKNK